MLTTALAARWRRLVALDPSAAALESAGCRVPVNVELRRGSIPGDWPVGRYDLVVLSEVGYYLDRPDLARLLDLVQRDLQPGGTLLACHCRHPVADYPLTGDDVHAALADRWPGTSRVSRIEEEDFLLDILQPGGAHSVVRRTGMLA